MFRFETARGVSRSGWIGIGYVTEQCFHWENCRGIQEVRFWPPSLCLYYFRERLSLERATICIIPDSASEVVYECNGEDAEEVEAETAERRDEIERQFLLLDLVGHSTGLWSHFLPFGYRLSRREFKAIRVSNERPSIGRRLRAHPKRPYQSHTRASSALPRETGISPKFR